MSAARFELKGRDLWSVPRSELERRVREAVKAKGAPRMRGPVRVRIVAPDSTEAQSARKPVAQAVVSALEGEGVIPGRAVERADYSYRMNPRDPRIVVEVEEADNGSKRR